MKTTILCAVCALCAIQVFAQVTPSTAVAARQLVIHSSEKTLRAADANCPAVLPKKYWVQQINLCTNDTQIIALTNRIDAACQRNVGSK